MTTEGRGIARQMGLERSTGQQYYLRSLQHYNDGDTENAILDISEAIYYDRGYAVYYSLRGIYYVTSGQLQGAETDLKYALKINRRDWLANFGLGIVQFLNGDLAGALFHFERAAKFNSRRPEIWYYRSVAAFYNRDYEKSHEFIERALTLFPDSDKRSREAKIWKKEIETQLPNQSASDPNKAAKKARPKK